MIDLQDLFNSAGFVTVIDTTAPPEHLVQFYENEEFFLDSFASYITEGLQTGEAVVVMGTRSHLDSLELRLTAQGFDGAAAELAGDYLPLEAHRAIETIERNAKSQALTPSKCNFRLLRQSSRQVLGDAGRLQQAVWSLVSNAIKFTPPGGHVTVTVEGSDPNILIRVRNTGQGITADFLPWVFDRFRQGDGFISRRQGGLGLGLAIVRHLVELHGGEVSAESDGVGRGATFAIALPAHAELNAVKLRQTDRPADGAAGF